MCNLKIPRIFYKALLMAGLILSSTHPLNQSVVRQREDFLRAEKLLAQGDEHGFLALTHQLGTYPLYPYLRYQWLKDHLQDTDKILAFLAEHHNSRYAEPLRSKWLDYLAKHEHWQAVIQHYQAADSVAQQCHFYWAQYQTGHKPLALAEAQRLWTVGDSQPDACAPLFAAWLKSPQFNHDWVWRRFELALDNDNEPLAVYLRRLLDKGGQKTANYWLQVYKNPLLIKDSSLWVSPDAQAARIFATGVSGLAAIDLDLAIHIWDGRKHYLTADRRFLDQVDKKLALALAARRDNRAYNRLNALIDTDDKVRAAKIRAALFEQNWPHVLDALAALPVPEQHEPAWQYWLARALAATGKLAQAQAIYNRLAEGRSFYGFLAADKVGKSYQIGDKPVVFDDKQRGWLANQADFRTAQEWMAQRRDVEARRQWWFAVSKLDNGSLMLAAKLAQQWQWDQIAIMTLAKADYWDDMVLRFPLRYVAEVSGNAGRQQLDPAVIFALIRQESMLDSHAQSSVGAKGLMQLMPGTARQMADKLKVTGYSDSQLFDPQANIRYGSYYFATLLKRFDGRLHLAAAAYNAGPNRVAKWLPANKIVPADIWIETISFKETRNYVVSVLAYAIIYQQRLQTDALKIKNMLMDVPTN
jgi:soluble lytic murein transglycosylase